MRERGIAGAEIVERDPDAGRVQLADGRADQLGVLAEEQRLRQLDAEPRRRHAALGKLVRACARRGREAATRRSRR